MNYFLCNTAALQANLTKSTFKVYQYLSKSANNKNRSCYKKVKTIAKHCNISDRTVERATKELNTKGLLEIKKQFVSKGIINTTKGRQINNLYILTDIPSVQNKNYQTYSCKTELTKLTLTGTELKVYHCLAARSNKNKECFPSSKQIASDCGISISTVFRCLKKLVSKSIIKLQNQYRNIVGKQAKSNNLYNLNCALTQYMKCHHIAVTCPAQKISKTKKTRFPSVFHTFLFVLFFVFHLLSPSYMSPMSPRKTISISKTILKKGRCIYSKFIERYILRE